ncbi:MAG: ATP-binding protein [Bacteroides sp.]
MKKRNIINLIRYYSENNDAGFRTEAYEIARDFDSSGDEQLAEYIMALLSDVNAFVPQMDTDDSCLLQKTSSSNRTLPLPEAISQDIKGIMNAIGHDVGINKFLFQGLPGTGKTETAKHVSRILDREMFSVDFDSVIDSKMGQTSKNISTLFQEINDLRHPERVLILFDEIDALALDRTNVHDVREMGRATSAVFKGLDNLNKDVVLIATTNLFDSFDKALARRFDSIIDFNRYSHEDLLEIASILMDDFSRDFKFVGKNIRLFNKIMRLMDSLPYPGELKNLIKASIAFSNPGDEFDYLKRLYKSTNREKDIDLKRLKDEGFTIREMEILTGMSKATISRELKDSE